jgi:hypothetical protein
MIAHPGRHPAAVSVHVLAGVALATLLAGCPFVQDSGSATTARNAERHSSALVAEVGAVDARGVVAVEVNVRNGVPYASAELRPAGRGSGGILTFMVIAKSGMGQLVGMLTQGC